MASTDITPKLVTVVDRVLGVELIVSTAETHELAAYLSGLAQIRGLLDDEEAIVQRELLVRLDRSGKWTHHVPDPDRPIRFKLRAPSPTAGTDDYVKDVLRAELLGLLSADPPLIDREAARAALRRTVTVTMEVDVPADLGGFEKAAKATTAVGGVKVYDIKVVADEKVVVAGVNALKRVGGGVAEAVERARRVVPQGPRRVKVDVETRTT